MVQIEIIDASGQASLAMKLGEREGLDLPSCDWQTARGRIAGEQEVVALRE